jgi:hypothetical protein
MIQVKDVKLCLKSDASEKMWFILSLLKNHHKSSETTPRIYSLFSRMEQQREQWSSAKGHRKI